MNASDTLILGSIQIKKICINGEFSYLEFKDLEDPEYLWKEWANGTKCWYLNGKLHREGGPAVESISGAKEWYLNGELHREGGPACEWANGDKSWWLNGKLHREDGPACENANGDKSWYLNDNLHREDGPAIEWANGDKWWYLNYKRLSEKEHQEQTQLCINKVVEIDGKKYKLVEVQQ